MELNCDAMVDGRVCMSFFGRVEWGEKNACFFGGGYFTHVWIIFSMAYIYI